jgi:integrative and conjugative element protein (TIGR02256 family)
MLRLALPAEIAQEMARALERSGRSEIGGVLMGEHLSDETFVVREITIHRIGAFASFLRRMEEALSPLSRFFERTQRQYTRFNYIGEWHSHPSFQPVPSACDSLSMREIVEDPAVGAHFAALLIVKLDEAGRLIGTAHAYFPGGGIESADLTIGPSPSQGGERTGGSD